MHGQIHGSDQDRQGDYVSNLPMLELYYNPKMKPTKMTSHLTEDGEITGIQIMHENTELGQELDLNIIGEEGYRTHD